MNQGPIHGIIDRRLLVNFRADPKAVAKLLPSKFKPQLFNGHAMVGICLIRFSKLRPRGVPGFLGLNSENAAHRIAVEWDENGVRKTGVYVHRRDTSLWFNTLIGGRLFPGVHHRADFAVSENNDEFSVGFKSRFNGTEVKVKGKRHDQLPASSIFKSVEESSEFFKGGSVGFSPGYKKDDYQGLQLITENWRVEPFEVRDVYSSYFSDKTKFPEGSVTFDHALIMRNLPHSWKVVR